MVEARRLVDGPIIHRGMLPGTDGESINGPSLIAAPDWLPRRLGRFYLYFAHHAGRYIRLAYADDLAGPWTVHQPGTLRLEEAPACRSHIASPDVHVDPVRREIIMFFHGPILGSKEQRTFVARSTDGIRFVAGTEQIADFYFRTVPWRDRWVGMSKGGTTYISGERDGKYGRVPGEVFPPYGNSTKHPRHVALRITDDVLQVLYTQVGGLPEQIYSATVDLTAPVDRWKAVDHRLVLAPERPWEGAGLPPRASRLGAARGPENALRDPAIFSWDGGVYFAYAAAGESGIGIAKLIY